MHVYKSKRVSSFTFFGTVRHFPKEKNFRKFQVFRKKNVLRFLSLRYSADFRRSRLVLYYYPAAIRPTTSLTLTYAIYLASVAVRITERASSRTNMKPILNLIGRRNEHLL